MRFDTCAIDRERSWTRAFFSPISFVSLRPSHASTRTPREADLASVGYFKSASVTVEPIRTARGLNPFSRVAFTINARVSDTISEPIRLVSLRTVHSSGTPVGQRDATEPAQMNRGEPRARYRCGHHAPVASKRVRADHAQRDIDEQRGCGTQ